MKSKVDRMRARYAARAGGSVASRPSAEPPALWSENLPAWSVFERARTQLILGAGGGAAGILHSSIDWYMNLLGIDHDDRLEVFDLFCLIERLYIRSLNDSVKRRLGEG